MKDNPSFLEVFPFCSAVDSLCGGLGNTIVGKISINRDKMTMTADIQTPRMADRSEIGALERMVASEYGLNSVSFRVEYEASYADTVSEDENTAQPAAVDDSLSRDDELPPAVSALPKESDSPPKKATVTLEKKGKNARPRPIFGTRVVGKAVPLATIEQDSGVVTVEGEVYETSSRDLKRDAAVLGFYITDHTGSIKITKYLTSDDDQSIIKKIKPGMQLAVRGHVTYNRYENDIVLEPRGICMAEKKLREDTAEQKRVELHLHTRMSALDALTDPAAAVATAARWGHKAIAITDHGVAQAFPEVWKARQKHDIKIIYGLEGYFVNDDDRAAVKNPHATPLAGEFVAFDIETTGLNSRQDRMTEIGAVIFRGSEILGSMNTFVDPEMPIPYEITKLTGITDADVEGAPSERDAVERLIEFTGGRPLVAHNAEFDLGFINAACARAGIEYEPEYLDSLVMSQGLFREADSHRLNVVAKRLGLPKFRHHRAEDDAVTVARIMEKFFEILTERGALATNDIDGMLGGAAARMGRTRHIILLAKNRVGLKNLYELITASHLEHFHRFPIILKSLLDKHREGLIVGSACYAGELMSAISDGADSAKLKKIAAYYDYLEVQPECNNEFLIREGRVDGIEGVRDLTRRVLQLGRLLDKPVVATGDVHFLEPDDEILRSIIMAGKGFDDADAGLPIYLKSTDEMLREFAWLGQETAQEIVVTNPNLIADMVEDIVLFDSNLYKPKIENSSRDLAEIVYGRMRELYGDDPPEVVVKRTEEELRDILSREYDVIYMSARFLVQNSLDAGYLVGSRGSVGSSIVAYFLGITEVNALPAHYRCPKCRYSDFQSGEGYGCGADMPDKTCLVCGAALEQDGFDIPFETFLGIGGDKTPDIDLNFSGEFQSTAHKFTRELFGSDHVFKAGTIGTLAEKTAFGFVRKYLEAQGRVVTRAEENRLVKGLVGVKRTTGQHPGGLVIIPQDMEVTDFCPVQRPADDQSSDIKTTHFDYHSMEDNLLKLDELGHDDPTMIKNLEDMTGVDARALRLDDPDTMRIFCSPEPLGLPDDDPIIGKTGTIGIPEFGTQFTRGMLADTSPTEFSTLVRLSGFSHGTDVWLGNAKELILSGTATISETIGCRDDIMLYLISKGMSGLTAFKIMEAVRKGRGLTPDWANEMLQLGVPEWYVESCKKIKYLFPKAHAVAYVIMAFRIAWFKVHKPLAYYAAYFMRRADSFDAAVMTQGIEPVKARIKELSAQQNQTQNEQQTLITLEAVYEFYSRSFSFDRIDVFESDPVRFLLSGESSLRVPFSAISGLGAAAAEDLARARDKGGFISAEDLAMLCPKVSQTHMAELRALGALGSLPESRQLSMF